MTKEEFKELCLSSKNGIYARESYIKRNFPEIYNEIIQKNYPQQFGFQQRLYHYIENDDFLKLGVCPICGNHSVFINLRVGYLTYCSNNCACSSKDRNNKISKSAIKKTKEEKDVIHKKKCETKLNRYGNENYNNYNKIKQTKKEKYGNAYYNNSEQIQKTLLEKTDDETKDIVQRVKETKKKKYGNENYVNKEKIKKTWELKTEEDIKKRTEKTKKTNLFRYGDENYSNIEKQKRTKRQKEILKKPEIIGYADDNQIVFKCNDNICTLCNEKTYKSPKGIYNDRKRLGLVTCTKLNPIHSFVSGCEKELYNYITSVYKGSVFENDRKVLNGKELDIYIPDKRLAFEYNGLFWHSEGYVGKNYHKEKTLGCIKNGVRLIHIWEDDWIEKKEILKNLINGLLGLHTFKINARDCEIHEIDTENAKQFCNKYHIQGYCGSKVKVGLFNNGTLVMVALFGKKRRLSGGVPKDNEWELYRMCSVFNTRVRGGASKLINWFVKTYKPNSVTTFADLCISNGETYEKIGFKKTNISEPSYWWVCNNKRHSRQKFQKSNLIECVSNPKLTENDVMVKRGYTRCWDAGKIKYVYTPDL